MAFHDFISLDHRCGIERPVGENHVSLFQLIFDRVDHFEQRDTVIDKDLDDIRELDHFSRRSQKIGNRLWRPVPDIHLAIRLPQLIGHAAPDDPLANNPDSFFSFRLHR